jgi:hypothetical protein
MAQEDRPSLSALAVARHLADLSESITFRNRGSPGTSGASGVSSPIIFLLEGQAPPPGYLLIGRLRGNLEALTPARGKRDEDTDRRLTILVYQRK